MSSAMEPSPNPPPGSPELPVHTNTSATDRHCGSRTRGRSRRPPRWSLVVRLAPGISPMERRLVSSGNEGMTSFGTAVQDAPCHGRPVLPCHGHPVFISELPQRMQITAMEQLWAIRLIRVPIAQVSFRVIRDGSWCADFPMPVPDAYAVFLQKGYIATLIHRICCMARICPRFCPDPAPLISDSTACAA